MTLLELAHKLRPIIEQAAQSLDEKTASTAPEIFPRLKGDGRLIQAGTIVNWYGALKRAAADLWDTEQNTPENAPALWEEIAYRDGYRIIPEVITVGLAFAQGECGWWTDGSLYKSLLANNVHTPAQYPQGWEKVELLKQS